MFNAYVLDRRVRLRNGWFASALAFALFLAVAGVAAAVIASYWDVNRLSPKYRSISFMPSLLPPASPPPSPGPPPPLAKSKKALPDTARKLAQVVQPVQPDPNKPKAPDPADASDADQDGQPDGHPNGKPGGTNPNGDPNSKSKCTINCDPNGVPTDVDLPQQTQKEAPKVVTIEAIAGQRISGREQIPLPADVKTRATKEGNRNFMAFVKLCLDTAGAPDRIELVRSSGYSEADRAILGEMQGWRFRAYTVNGKPVPVCTMVTFHYIIED